MATVYCTKCYALMSDRDTRCRACNRWNPQSPVHDSVGNLMIGGIVGGIMTLIYARLLYIGWPSWERLFDADAYNQNAYAEEAALLVGLAIFFFTSILTMLAFRTGKAR